MALVDRGLGGPGGMSESDGGFACGVLSPGNADNVCGAFPFSTSLTVVPDSWKLKGIVPLA